MSTEPLHSGVLNVLMSGTAEKPVSRSTLVFRTGLSDRMVRATIAELKDAGEPIVSLTRGYFLANPEELASYALRETTRARTLINRVKKWLPKKEMDVRQMGLGF